MAMAPLAPLVLGCQASELAMRYGPTIMQLAAELAVQWADKLPAVDWLFSSTEQGTHSAGQQNAGNSASGDPNDPWNRFRNSGLQNKDISELRSASTKSSNFNLDKAYQQLDFFKQNNVQISGHALVEAQADNISSQNIFNTFNRVQGYGTQVFESAEPGRLVVWSSVQRLAVVVESSTREIVTVFNRTTPQNTWTPLNPLQIPTWLQLK